jgi:hypothetical protein
MVENRRFKIGLPDERSKRCARLIDLAAVLAPI